MEYIIFSLLVIAYLVFIYKRIMRRKKKKIFAKFVSLSFNGLKFEGELVMETITMKSNQFFDTEIEFVNERNKPAKVESGSVKFFLRDSEGNDVEDALAVVTQDPANENAIHVQTKNEDVLDPVSYNLWTDADADLKNDADDSTSGDVKEVEILLATIVVIPLLAVGAGFKSTPVVKDVA